MSDDYETLPDGNVKVPLPDGHWAEVRPVDDLRRGDERAIFKLADADGVDFTGGEPGIDFMAALQDAVVARMVRRWSFKDADEGGKPTQRPVTSETVADLHSRHFGPLAKATGPVLAELLSNLSAAESAVPKSAPGSSSPDAPDA